MGVNLAPAEFLAQTPGEVFMRIFTLNHLPRLTQNDRGANALEYALVLILVAFAIVAGVLGTGGIFEFLGASRVTQVIGLAEQLV
jgi:Flp pilus assembly pilin Flp